MALYWTSGGDWSPATGGSHWSLIGDLELKIRQEADDRQAAADSASSPDAEPSALDDTPDDPSAAGRGRR
jgi:hypothetical protein